MNFRAKQYVERIRALISESDKVLQSSKQSSLGHSYIEDKVLLNSWLTKVKNIILITFGVHSVQNRELNRIAARSNTAGDVNAIKGFLIGALDDLENGYIVGQEFIIAAEIFDNVLEEAKHLLESKHKDAAAVLGRVIVEDTLKRIAKREGVTITGSASRINDELKKEGVYTQPQWRLVQSWLDVGNSAAHGKFEEYDSNDVGNMLSGIEQFMASMFSK